MPKKDEKNEDPAVFDKAEFNKMAKAAAKAEHDAEKKK